MEADDRDELLRPLLRLKKTVPRKIPIVTQRTPRLPQSTPLQPEANSGASDNPERSTDIDPPEIRRSWFVEEALSSVGETLTRPSRRSTFYYRPLHMPGLPLAPDARQA